MDFTFNFNFYNDSSDYEDFINELKALNIKYKITNTSHSHFTVFVEECEKVNIYYYYYAF